MLYGIKKSELYTIKVFLSVLQSLLANGNMSLRLLIDSWSLKPMVKVEISCCIQAGSVCVYMYLYLYLLEVT